MCGADSTSGSPGAGRPQRVEFPARPGEDLCCGQASNPLGHPPFELLASSRPFWLHRCSRRSNVETKRGIPGGGAPEGPRVGSPFPTTRGPAPLAGSEPACEPGVQGAGEVDAVMADGEAGVIDAEEVEDGGVDVVAIDRVIEGLVAPLVALAEGDAAADAAASEPVGEGEGVVVAAFAALAAAAR